jgi:hypothetical protein
MEKNKKKLKNFNLSIFNFPSSIFYLLSSIFCLAISTQSYAADFKDIFSGYYKVLPTFTKSSSTKENISAVLQRLRLEFKPQLTKNIKLFVTYDHELLLNDFSQNPDFALIRQDNQKDLAWWDADQVISDTKHVYEQQLLFRCYLQFESEKSRIAFGKQLIDWGRLRFYSPLDLFNPPNPSDIEADERTGFDALNIELFGDNFTSLNLIYGPGHTSDEDSYALRLYKKIFSYDTFFIVAKHLKEKTIGLGFDGYLKKAGFRGEFTFTKLGQERYPRAALGLDYSFSAKTSGLAEYFYNGAANGDYAVFSTSLLDQRQKLSLKKQLLSLSLTHEITPLFKFKWAAIYDIVGKSVFLNPELRYNITENTDAAIGAQFFAKNDNSEFQDKHNMYYAEVKLFF